METAESSSPQSARTWADELADLGLSPLPPLKQLDSSPQRNIKQQSNACVRGTMSLVDSDNEQPSLPTRRSSARLKEKMSIDTNIADGQCSGMGVSYEVLELPQLFDTSCCLQEGGVKKMATKRAATTPTSTAGAEAKVAKMECGIPTKAFYSMKADTSIKAFSSSGGRGRATLMDSPPTTSRHAALRQKSLSDRRYKTTRRGGVQNRRTRNMPPMSVDFILEQLGNQRLQRLIKAERDRKHQIEKVHNIFKCCKNPITMARPLSAIRQGDDHNNNADTPDTNDIKCEEDLCADFSDLESTSEEEELEHCDEQVSPINQNEVNNVCDGSKPQGAGQRRFFRSMTRTRKEFSVMRNIKCTVKHGKIALLPPKKTRKRLKIKNKVMNEYADEQATVDEILKNLDDTAYGDLDEQDTMATDTESRIVPMQTPEMVALAEKYRGRLPFQTTDENVFKQQKTLLEFLISNNICNARNFHIFIADPDNNRKEASDIVDQVETQMRNQQTAFRARLPYNTMDPVLFARQQELLEFLITHDICTEETFDIFIANYETRRAEANAIVIRANLNAPKLPALGTMDTETGKENAIVNTLPSVVPPKDETVKAAQETPQFFSIFYNNLRCQPLPIKVSTRRLPRLWPGGKGLNQYQIDAGQKRYGAQQCKQCGLLYSANEPEEERLHRDYHVSQHVLRFKSWINEDVVVFLPEWDNEGRIIRLTENSHPKHKERLNDVLTVVDKELGYASYVIPKTFVAFLAIKQYQIVGVCLVQPLDRGHKYVCVNGVDCCTEETYEAKCGISRIWVSPLHRRLGIATKLLRAVQVNTLLGCEIPMEKIAFSTPTEQGRLFAQKAVKLPDFLIYQ